MANHLHMEDRIHSTAAPQDALAVASWRTRPDVALDLRYEPDEADLLQPRPSALWKELLDELPRYGADLIASYPVDDPYAGGRAAEIISEHFGCSIEPEQITFGAGVSSLLHALVGLADARSVCAPSVGHPDFEVWAASRGINVFLLDGAPTRDRLISFAATTRPAVLHMDRPSFTGETMSFRDLHLLAERAARLPAIVLVDESAANYLGPAASAVRLIAKVENLVVLRGFTKAYSWGGLRVGFAVCSKPIAGRIRGLMPPMQVSNLALAAALRLLAQGDILGALRARIRAVKPIGVQLLEAAGMTLIDGHEDIPWVVVIDYDGTAAGRLAKVGICGLRPERSSGVPRSDSGYLHLNIPLSERRLALFEKLLTELKAP